MARLSALLEKAKSQTASTPEFRTRVEFIAEKFYQPLCRGAEEYNRSAAAVAGWKGVMPALDAAEKIVIDGKADDKAWNKAKSYFLLPNPAVKSESVEVRTSFKALRDKDNFYFFVSCEEPLTSKMTSIIRKRDDTNIWQDNEVELFLDPDCSGKGGYQLIFNSSGSLSDNHFAPLLNWKWDSGAEWRVRITPGSSWNLEVRLPVKNMKAAKNKLSFNVIRSRFAGNDRDPFQTWSPKVRRGHDVENYGTLEFTGNASESLIKGGDFTEKQIGNRLGRHIPPRWCSASKAKLIQDTKVFRTGGVSLRLDENCDGVVYYDLPFLKADTRYRISYYIKLDKIESLFQWGGGVCIALDCGILPRKIISFPPKNGKYVGTMPWTYQSFEFRTPKNLRQNINRCYLHISRFKKYNRGTAWIDQVELHELPEK